MKKYHDAILKLRENKKLAVEEALKLEQKIQEIEKENQSIGVELGDLLGKDPSYNLFLKLDESLPGGSRDRTFTPARRLGSAFLWALGWWIMSALGIGLGVATFLSIRTLWPSARSVAAQPPPVPAG